MLEEKVTLLEQEKAVASCFNVLTALRSQLSRRPSLFDRHEGIVAGIIGAPSKDANPQ